MMTNWLLIIMVGLGCPLLKAQEAETLGVRLPRATAAQRDDVRLTLEGEHRHPDVLADYLDP